MPWAEKSPEEKIVNATQSFLLDSFGDVRDCYTIDNGVYVYVDPDLKKALTVVRKMQKSSAEERKAFIRSPQRVIREHLGNDVAAETVERLFVETEQYAKNVVGLGISPLMILRIQQTCLKKR